MRSGLYFLSLLLTVYGAHAKLPQRPKSLPDVSSYAYEKNAEHVSQLDEYKIYQSVIIKNSVKLVIKQLAERYKIPYNPNKIKSVAHKIGAYLEKNPVEISLLLHRISPEIIISAETLCKHYWKDYTKLLTLLSAAFEMNALELICSSKDAAFGREGMIIDSNNEYIPARLWNLHVSLDQGVELIRQTAKNILDIVRASGQLSEAVSLLEKSVFDKSKTKGYISKSKSRIDRYFKEKENSILSEDIASKVDSLLNILYPNDEENKIALRQTFISTRGFLKDAVKNVRFTKGLDEIVSNLDRQYVLHVGYSDIYKACTKKQWNRNVKELVNAVNSTKNNLAKMFKDNLTLEALEALLDLRQHYRSDKVNYLIEQTKRRYVKNKKRTVNKVLKRYNELIQEDKNRYMYFNTQHRPIAEYVTSVFEKCN